MTLRRNSRIIDELDVTLGFADLAGDMKFAKPKLTNEYAFCYSGTLKR